MDKTKQSGRDPMRMRTLLKLTVGNTLALRLLTVVAFFFLIFPTLKDIVDGLVKVVLVWGFAQLVYDFSTGRRFLKANRIVWLLLFLLMEIITVGLNYSNELKNNASLFCYSVVAMLLFYPNDEDKDPRTLLKELRLLGYVFIGLCTVASLISLLTFVSGYSGTVVYMKTLYYTGVFEGRLWGIYSNPNFPAAILAAILSLVLMSVCRHITVHKRTLWLQYTLLALGFVFNFWYTVLAQSRGCEYAFLAFVGVSLFFVLRKTICARLRSFAVSCVISLAVAVVCVVGVNAAFPLIVKASSGLPETLSGTAAAVLAPEDEPAVDFTEDELGRDQEITEENVLTNRPLIWKAGLEKFMSRPLFGFGNSGSTHGTEVNGTEIKHFHSFFVQSLVSNGLAGTLPMLIFLLLCVVTAVKYVWQHRREDAAALKRTSEGGAVYGLLAVLAFYAANNMVEVFIAYSVSIPNFLFWMLLGYTMSLITGGKPAGRSDLIARRLSGRGEGHTA